MRIDVSQLPLIQIVCPLCGQLVEKRQLYESKSRVFKRHIEESWECKIRALL